jgi:RNA polymerase sigma-70 factor (ECF subfamily)
MSPPAARRDSAVEWQLRANASDLLSFFRYRVDADDAAELLSETMLVAWRKAAEMPNDDRLARMWLFGIAKFALSNSQRSARRRTRLAAKLREAVRTTDQLHPASDAGAEIRDAVGRLPGELGELVRLIHWDGFTVKEAGQLMGLPDSTARNKYQAAKAQLRAALAEGSVTASRQ